MADEKIKVKDLATELGVQPKDILRASRALGFAVKSTAGSLESDEAGRLRAYFSEQAKAGAGSTAGQPQVIVRRRRRTDPDKAPQMAPNSPVQITAAEAKGSDDVAGASGESRPHVAPANGQEESAAQSAGVATSQPAAAYESGGEEPAQAQESETVLASPKTGREGAGPKAPRSAGARIISRPGEAASKTQEVPPVKVTAPEPAPRQTSPVKAGILAREESARAARESVSSGSQEKTVKRLSRPDASATPEGSSAPALAGRRGQDRPAEQEKAQPRESAAKKPSTPSVRIISRPEPSAAQQRPAPRQRAGARSEGGRGQTGAGPAGARSSGRPGFGGQRQPGAARPDFAQAPAQPTDGRDNQNKKKRLKGRRTVDFQQGDFGRHRDEDDNLRMTRSRGRRKAAKPQAPAPVTQPLKAAKRKIRVSEFIRVADMAHQMGLKANEIIKVLFNLGVMATINQALDIDTATLVAAEFDYEVEKSGFFEDDVLAAAQEDTPESLRPRAPVVTIMGHVDHGKTSLLDAIRKSNVTSGEAGGITQHIGAYHVRTKRGEIVFLDTPGHEAFTAMRARGAQVTDLVILVVAADDGVMEQTREAINHSRAANVPIMVAVNKIDKPGADPDRVLRELSELGLQPEDWGGDTIVSRVSAKTREGLDDLLELVALQSEIMDLKANPNKAARGHIIEARLDKGRGPVATVLIQGGTLKQGDNFVCGQFSGRVRALINDQGRKTNEAGPSMPVEVQGFEGVPEAGEEFLVVEDEKLARRIASTRATKQREKEMAAVSRVTLETFLAQSPGDEETLSLNLVLKADVQGTLEAITEALNKLSTEKVRINIVHGGTGAISESDIQLASASKAIIIGFNVRPAARIRDAAEHENVDIRFYDIIYKLVDDIRNAMAGLLAPVQREVYLGQAEVRQTYSVARVGVIAGSYVSDGKIARNAGVRLLRDGVVIYTGKVASLRRFKDDVREVAKGNECGIGLENFNDIKIGDIIEAFETVEEAATL